MTTLHLRKSTNRSPLWLGVLLTALALFAFLPTPRAFAGSATWASNPTSGDWNTAANWSPQTVPNSVFDTATFQTSAIPNVSISDDIGVNNIVFNSNGPTGPTSFTITVSAPFAIDNAITNNSGVTQNFVTAAGGFIAFQGDVGVVGSGIVFTINVGSEIDFDVSAGAGNAAFHNKGGTSGNPTIGGQLAFFDQGDAGTAKFTNDGGTVSGARGGLTFFSGDSTADNGTFINKGATISGATGGLTEFTGASTADNAILIANGGTNGGVAGSSHLAIAPIAALAPLAARPA